MELKELLKKTAGLMTVAGYEATSHGEVAKLFMPYFDEYKTDKVGNIVFIKKCGKENAKKILIDAHFDEVGMLVTEICDGGYLRVTNVGGIDSRILSASEAVIYGAKKIYGLFISVPPHLQKPEERGKLKKINELLIDTGFSKEELEKYVNIGTPVGFMPNYTDLLNGNISGKGFDNKACAAIGAYAVGMLKDTELSSDIYLSLSTREEVGQNGANNAVFETEPDNIIVLDACFGFAPEGKRPAHALMGGGPDISYSVLLDRAFTKFAINVAKEKEIPYQIDVEANDTGTNANYLPLIKDGIPTVLISLPLVFMHTYNEMINVKDAENTAKLICEIIKAKDAEFAAKAGKIGNGGEK